MIMARSHRSRCRWILSLALGGIVFLAAFSSRLAFGQPRDPYIERWLNDLPVWHSSQLGVDYQLAHYVKYYKGALAARVAAAPGPGAPATRIRRSDNGKVVLLEPGDLILAMDEKAFYSRADFDDHVAESTIYFRDSRTGLLQYGRTVLPATVTASTFLRGDRSGSEDKVYQAPLDKSGTTPFAKSQPELRGLVLQAVQDGEVILHTPRVRDNGLMSRRWFNFGPYSASGAYHETVGDQALVESLRTSTRDPLLRQYLSSGITNVELLIDRKLGYLNQGQPEKILKDQIDQKIEFQYMRAVFTTATARGESLPPFAPLPSVAYYAMGPMPVRLLSQRNATAIQYMPRLNWWIITKSQHREPKDLEWSTCKPGEKVQMSGFYAYVARYADGSADPPRDDLHITTSGDVTLP
jgi:hypothetical protein